MNVRVEENRFLSVACEPDERIVFDRKETRYHLLRDSAARLWDEICEGGTFEVAAQPGEKHDPVVLLAEAGLVGIEDDAPGAGITRRVWLSRTGKVSAAAVVLPLVASISTPRLVLGQTNGPSLEEDLVDQTSSETSSDTVTPTTTRTRGRGESTSGDDLPGTRTRTRTRTRTGQLADTEGTETGTRTRGRDR